MCQCQDVCSETRATTARSLGGLQTGYAVDEIREARLVDEFRFAIDDLNDVVAEARERLRPVSQLEYPEPSGSQPESVCSDARTELYRIHELRGALRGILDRLEV